MFSESLIRQQGVDEKNYKNTSKYLHELIQEARATRAEGFLAPQSSDQEVQRLKKKIEKLEDRLAVAKQQRRDSVTIRTIKRFRLIRRDTDLDDLFVGIRDDRLTKTVIQCAVREAAVKESILEDSEDRFHKKFTPHTVGTVFTTLMRNQGRSSTSSSTSVRMRRTRR